MSYSVGVQNAFELLSDENDDQPNIRTPKTKLEDDKPQAKPVQRKSEPVVGDRAPVKAHRDQNRKEGGNQRSPKPRGDRPPRADGERPPRTEGDRPRQDRPRRPRPEGAAGGSPTGVDGERRPRNPRPQHKGEERDKERWQKENREAKQGGGEHTGKRIFDRRSGTGRGPRENKKGGAGPANWGNEKDPQVELQAEQEVKADTTAEQTEEQTPVTTDDVEPTPVKDDEPQGVSMEEFRKQQQEKSSGLPSLPAPRQAGEGVSAKERDSWAQVSLASEAASAPAPSKDSRNAAKKETVNLGQFFHVKSKEERDRAEKPFRDRRDDRRDDRKPRAEKPRTDRKPQPPRGPSKPKADIVKNDQEFPTLATKA